MGLVVTCIGIVLGLCIGWIMMHLAKRDDEREERERNSQRPPQ